MRSFSMKKNRSTQLTKLLILLVTACGSFAVKITVDGRQWQVSFESKGR